MMRRGRVGGFTAEFCRSFCTKKFKNIFLSQSILYNTLNFYNLYGLIQTFTVSLIGFVFSKEYLYKHTDLIECFECQLTRYAPAPGPTALS